LEGKGAEEEEQICELLDVGDMGSLALAKGSMLAGWNAARVPLCSFGGGMQLREMPPATEWRFLSEETSIETFFWEGHLARQASCSPEEDQQGFPTRLHLEWPCRKHNQFL
jgi:hypothetical protein